MPSIWLQKKKSDSDLLVHTPCDDNFDLLIGCTSIAYNFVCVTDNTKHFENFKGISLENWIVRDR